TGNIARNCAVFNDKSCGSTAGVAETRITQATTNTGRIAGDGAISDCDGAAVVVYTTTTTDRRITRDGTVSNREGAENVKDAATVLPEMMLFSMLTVLPRVVVKPPGDPPVRVTLRSVRFPVFLTTMRSKLGAFAWRAIVAPLPSIVI